MNAVSYYLPDRDHTTAKIESTIRIKGAEPLRFVDREAMVEQLMTIYRAKPELRVPRPEEV